MNFAPRLVAGLLSLALMLFTSFAWAAPASEGGDFSPVTSGEGSDEGREGPAATGPSFAREKDSDTSNEDSFTRSADALVDLAEALAEDCGREAPASDAAKAAANKSLCQRYCHADKVDFCALRSRSIAASALAGAKPTVRIIHDKLLAGATKDEAAAASYPMVAAHFNEAARPDSKYNSGSLPQLGSDLAALALRTAVALGKLALDRAKQEAVIWALDQLGRHVCSPKDQPILAREANEFWLPQTCSFANRGVLQQGFGAGNDMLDNLVAALENDLRRLPGTAAGTLIGAGFWAESRSESPEAMFGCETEPAADANPDAALTGACTRSEALRSAAADAVEGVVRGQDPFDEFEAFARRMDQIQREDAPAPNFHAPIMQIGLCAASLGVEFGIEDRRALIPSAAKQALGGGEYETIVAALVHYPACWSLVGYGFTDLELLEQRALAAKRGTGQDVERLTTVIRLHQWWTARRVRLESSVSAIRQLETRALGLQAQINLLRKDAKSDLKQVRATTLLLAGLDLAEQGIELADAFVFLFEGAAATRTDLRALFPGLALAATNEDDGAVALPAGFADLHRATASAKEINLAARALLEKDWGSAMVRSLALLRSFEARVQLQHQSSEKLSAMLDRLGEYGGMFVAIVQAKDADALAAVLAKTANPPGGWRRKQVPGSFTLSIASHVGFQTGLELRSGQYGATYERGAAYYQAPTLTVPIGLDLAWGSRKRFSNGLFIPFIDPAAFLQYDISQSGRLPGPRPLTVLSPGIAYRMGIPTTPITVLLGYYYRPQLRTWEATVNGPGADAHQLALSIAVDATLWNIVKRSSGKQAKQ